MKLDARQIATVIAGLKLWQSENDARRRHGAFENFKGIKPMSAFEVDELIAMFGLVLTAMFRTEAIAADAGLITIDDLAEALRISGQQCDELRDQLQAEKRSNLILRENHKTEIEKLRAHIDQMKFMSRKKFASAALIGILAHHNTDHSDINFNIDKALSHADAMSAQFQE